MMSKDKIVVVTGGAQGIGKCIAECFAREGATVHVIDVQEGPWFVGDLADKATLERFAADVVAKSGKVDVLVNNAMPLIRGVRLRAGGRRCRALLPRKALQGQLRRGSVHNQHLVLPRQDEPAA